MAEPGEALTLLAVLVRGLQGSGKSTLCRALAHLTQGEWINQDEVAAGEVIQIISDDDSHMSLRGWIVRVLLLHVLNHQLLRSACHLPSPKASVR